MSDFYTIILKVISDYKLILRKNFATAYYTATLHRLGIKRKYIKGTDEAGLYNIGLKIVAELKKYHHAAMQGKKSNNFYHGTLEFLQYLEPLLANYHVKDNRVIHLGQNIAGLLVAAIQLITLAKQQLTAQELLQLEHYASLIMKHGTKEQKKILLKAIKQQEYLAASLAPIVVVEFERS